MHAHNLAMWDRSSHSFKKDSLLHFTKRSWCTNPACTRGTKETSRQTPFLRIGPDWQSFQDNIRLQGQAIITNDQLLDHQWYNHEFDSFNDACARELYQPNDRRDICPKCRHPDHTLHIENEFTDSLPYSLCVQPGVPVQGGSPLPIPTTLQFAHVQYTITSSIYFKRPGHFVACARFHIDKPEDQSWYSPTILIVYTHTIHTKILTYKYSC
jgi:hypothetical protein